MPRAVIFDVDGTLVDSNDLHAQAWQEAFRRFGFDFPFGQVRQQIGKGGDQLIPALLPPRDNRRYHDRIAEFRDAHFLRNYLHLVRPFPQVRELLQRCRRAGLEAVLASSGKDKEVERHIESTGIEGLFEDRTSFEDAAQSKPHPDIFEAALKNLGSPAPREVIVVGDTPYDAEAAGKIGLRTIGLLCGGFPEAQLRAAGCVAIYRDPADLLAHFEASPLAEPPSHPRTSPLSAAFFWAGITGGTGYLAWHLYQQTRREWKPAHTATYSEEYIDETLDDSFPASDPPSFTPVSGTGRTG